MGWRSEGKKKKKSKTRMKSEMVTFVHLHWCPLPKLPWSFNSPPFVPSGPFSPSPQGSRGSV